MALRSAAPSLAAPLMLALLLVPQAAPAAPARATAKPRTAAAPMPDSVLAVVGGSRQVTAGMFRRAWTQVSPPARPDSLTPQGARQFLDLLIDKEALGALAARETWTWTGREKAEREALRDRLTMGALLDSSLVRARRRLGAAGDTMTREAAGIAAREHAVAGIHPTFDDSLAARLARVWAAIPKPPKDSSLMAQIRMMGVNPVVAPADTARVLARSDVGEYRVADLLRAWKDLNPLFRPRVETAEQIRDLARNGLFERMLREEARRQGLAERPSVIAALQGQQEYTDVTHLVQREVFAKIAKDSLTLRRHYAATQHDWDLPLRVRLVRVVLPDENEASIMAVRLRSVAEAESLAAMARHAGIDYSGEVSEASDSLLFRAAMRAGAGAVIGPTEVKDGWSVARVVAVLPGRGRSFSEVRALVLRDWESVEGERLTRALCDRARAEAGVRVNAPALDRLAAR